MLPRTNCANYWTVAASPPASKKPKNTASDSSLSPPSLNSPRQADADDAGSPGSDDSSDSRQPEPAAAIPQVQVFGPNPLKYDDPTTYHIRDVTPDMTDEEKKAIYCVNVFPRSDLRHLMAGTPPDRDFSNAKPTNQVNANTFLLYVDPYVRPMMEEDIAFLKEKVCFRIDGDLYKRLTDKTHRATESHHSSCRNVGRGIILTCGRKKMGS